MQVSEGGLFRPARTRWSCTMLKHIVMFAKSLALLLAVWLAFVLVSLI